MYTDGAARGNPDGPGGYGTILSFVDSKGQEHIKELSAGYQKTTNNRMEMMAVIFSPGRSWIRFTIAVPLAVLPASGIAYAFKRYTRPVLVKNMI